MRVKEAGPPVDMPSATTSGLHALDFKGFECMVQWATSLCGCGAVRVWGGAGSQGRAISCERTLERANAWIFQASHGVGIPHSFPTVSFVGFNTKSKATQFQGGHGQVCSISIRPAKHYRLYVNGLIDSGAGARHPTHFISGIFQIERQRDPAGVALFFAVQSCHWQRCRRLPLGQIGQHFADDLPISDRINPRSGRE